MSWVQQNIEIILRLLGTHLVLSLPAILLSVAIAIPLGWLAHRRRRIGQPLLTAVGLLYAIPSLALFVLVPVIVGVELRSNENIVIVLALYGAAILVRTCADAFDAVPADVRQAADALGYSPWRRFRSVDLPLAVPVIMAGVRVVVVSTVSLVTVGSVIGVQSLGTLFTDGFQRGVVPEVLTGLVLTMALALVLDALCVLLERILAPWKPGLARDGATSASQVEDFSTIWGPVVEGGSR